MKKPSRTTLNRKANKLWSEIIRKKNNGLCEVCGLPANNPHHIIGRRNLTLRHDLINGCLLCSGCHTLRVDSAHQNSLAFSLWVQANRFEDWKYLISMMRKLTTQVDYEEIINKLNEQSS